MSAHVGILTGDKNGLTTPSGGFAQKTQKKTNQEFVITKNESGVSADVEAVPYNTSEITMDGIGIADFTLVTPGTTPAGTLKVLSVKRGENSKGKKTFGIRARIRNNAS